MLDLVVIRPIMRFGLEPDGSLRLQSLRTTASGKLGGTALCRPHRTLPPAGSGRMTAVSRRALTSRAIGLKSSYGSFARCFVSGFSYHVYVLQAKARTRIHVGEG
jgi:hypothetical protein